MPEYPALYLLAPPPPHVDEQLTLDGLALHSSPFTLVGFEHKPAKKLLEWVKGADADGAKLLRLARYEQAEIQLQLRVEQQDTMDEALAIIGQVVDKLQEAERQAAGGRGRGLELVWSPAGSTFTGTFYVQAGEVDVPKAPESNEAPYLWRRPIINIVLVCDPFIYGAEVSTSVTTSALPLITKTVADVPGDVPAEARFTITDAAGQSRDYVVIGLENFNYGAGPALLIDSDSFVTSGFAGTQTTRTGAYDVGGGNTVVRGTLTPTAVAVCSSGELTHVGTFRNTFRLWPSSTNVSARMAWRQGRDQWTTEPWQQPPFEDAWWETDLGQSKIREAPLGTQTWQWRLEARSTVAGDTLDVDVHEMIPAGEGYGKARDVVRFETPTVFSARDEFDQSAGNLTGKTLPVGGVWVAAGPSAISFEMDVTNHVAQRSGVHDRRIAIAGTTSFTNCVVQSDAKASALGAPTPVGNALGVVARYVDDDNYLCAYWYAHALASSVNSVRVEKMVGGVQTILAGVVVPHAASTFYSTRLAVDAGGRWVLWHGQGVLQQMAAGSDSELATGGDLETGTAGFFDETSDDIVRNHDNFLVFVPSTDTVCNASQSVEFRSYGDDPVIREDTTGTYWGRPPESRGGRLWLPPAGDEDRTTRIAVMARRQDVETLPSEGITDSTTLAVSYRPRWIAVPRQA